MQSLLGVREPDARNCLQEEFVTLVVDQVRIDVAITPIKCFQIGGNWSIASKSKEVLPFRQPSKTTPM